MFILGTKLPLKSEEGGGADSPDSMESHLSTGLVGCLLSGRELVKFLHLSSDSGGTGSLYSWQGTKHPAGKWAYWEVRREKMSTNEYNGFNQKPSCSENCLFSGCKKHLGIAWSFISHGGPCLNLSFFPFDILCQKLLYGCGNHRSNTDVMYSSYSYSSNIHSFSMFIHSIFFHHLL